MDFPFILGADGTKVLKPRSDLFDAKFFYFALLSFDIPNRGYNRHFTILRERKVPRPEKDEQRKIAGVLGLVQRAMEQQERLIALTTELKKILLHQLFTHGLRGEPQKQTEIGLVPNPNGYFVIIGHDARREWVDDFSRQDGFKRGMIMLKAQVILRDGGSRTEPLTDSALTESMKRVPDRR